jgi:hypothetical protein
MSAQMPIAPCLLTRDNFGKHFPRVVDIMLKHTEYMKAQVRLMGLILPTSAFFKKEETRYLHIFAHTFYAHRLAAVREVLQNSSDAGTTELRVSAENPPAVSQCCLCSGFADCVESLTCVCVMSSLHRQSPTWNNWRPRLTLCALRTRVVGALRISTEPTRFAPSTFCR